MPVVPPTTTYGKPRYTTHHNPYATRHHHFKGTRASRPYYLHKYDDINKQLAFEKAMAKAEKDKDEAKKQKLVDAYHASKKKGGRTRRHTRRR